MSTSTVLLIAVVALVALAGIMLFTSSRRRDSSSAMGGLTRETRRRDRVADLDDEADADVALSGRAYERSVVRGGTDIVPVEAAPPAVYVPPDPETLGVTRRQFLNRSIIAMFGLSLSSFGAAVIAFLWPTVRGGFGSRINVGPVADVMNSIEANNGFFYVPEGRMWITQYPATALPKAQAAYSVGELGGMEAGLTALWQTCPHLGCRVPECVTSQWFECPCHGSQYNRNGEKKGGPAPRGMDRFVMSVDASGNFIVDTGALIPGPPIGTNTTGQEAEGPNCIGQATEH